jgi:Endonuclease I/Secretion system C-terminal sorting domain
MKKYYILLFSIIFVSGFSQVFINEIDPDTPSTDTLEFIELKSTTPNFPLDGYVLVFYNGGTTGTGNLSYFALDLDGYSTDANGNIHFGNAFVSPTPKIIIPNVTIQNGPDVVALFLGNASDYPLNTVATNTNVVDAIAYSNGSVLTATSLMTIFGLTQSINENINSNPANQSIQRKNDGTFEVKTPTPGVNNDGTGIVFNYVSFTSNVSTITEGQNLVLTFSTSQVVTSSPLTINFALNNGNFNASDFTGNLSAIIPVGSSSITATINVLNDGLNEGDEELKIVVSGLPIDFSLNNNNKIVRVNDINFIVLPFGTPLNPSYGTVVNSKPPGYYDSLIGLSGNALKQALQDIIANPTIVREHNYADVYTILRTADQNPANSNQVWLMYVEQPRSKIDQQVGNSNIGFWNREHIYCQSRGGFNLDSNVFPAGINVWTTTDANDITAGGTDAHHLRAEDGPENSLRSNRNYGTSDYNGPAGTQGSWRGDVARSLFYMAVRYNGLNVVNGYPPESPVGNIGNLATLLAWNTSDPSDDFEMNRNNYIYTWQQNRNPFIDMPNLANYIFGANFGQPWTSTLATQDFSESKIGIYPNPAKNILNVTGICNNSKVEIYNVLGEKVLCTTIDQNQSIPLNFSKGIYCVKITSDYKTFDRKLVIE